jgi:hypothetical protein
MKHRILTLLLFLSAIGSPAAFAQSQKMKVDVPFSFYMGEKKLPAGEYYIRQITEGAVALTNSNGAAVTLTPFISKEPIELSTEAKLQFTKLGDDYFLARVVDGTKEHALVLPVTHIQREVARKNATEGMEYQGSK